MSKKSREKKRLLEQARRPQGLTAGAQAPSAAAQATGVRPQPSSVAPSSPAPTQPPSPQPAGLVNFTPQMQSAISDAQDAAEEHGVPDPALPPPPKGITVDDAWGRLEGAKRRYNEATKTVEAQQERLKQQERDLDVRLKATTDLDARERDIEERELDAEAGFSRQNRLALAALERESDQLREKIDERRELARKDEADREARDLAADAAWRDQSTRRREQLREDLDEATRKLASERELEAALHAEVVARTAALDDRERELERRICAVAAERVATLQLELDAARRAEEAYKAEGQQLQADLAELRSQARRVRGRSVEDVAKELEAAIKREAQLEKELSNRPSADAASRLKRLQDAEATWHRERTEMTERLASSENERNRLAQTAWVADQQRVSLQVFEQQKRVLEERIAQLVTTIDQHLKAADGGSPFKVCSGFDRDPDLQTPTICGKKATSLKTVSGYLHQRIASGVTVGQDDLPPLYYPERDVRSFLAGMATSRLLLLQGMSGIGKTSLPRAIGGALKGQSVVIPVQAGWRDRHDLLGHYNTFEGRYRESEFLRAMYLAGTPKFRDVVFFIVLDEVNLSRPEQYFADVLSALELGKVSGNLVLTDISVADAPLQLVEGRMIRFPPNVWFVGTANHDETTLEFADKTIDRAHILELPPAPTPFTVSDKPELARPLSCSRLTELFEACIPTFTRQIDDVQALFFEVLREELANRFGIGLSGRLSAQIGRYVPVVLEAGGTITEAADHLLATRVLRHVQNRFDLRPKELQDFLKLLLDEWRALDNKEVPERSVRMLKREVQRLQAQTQAVTGS